MSNPRAVVLTGAGINCERESAAALNHVGFDATIIHIVDLLQDSSALDDARFLLFPGGFSYGDHAGAAFVLAEQMRRLEDVLKTFVEKKNLVLGICNGCQLLLRLGMIGESKWGFRENAGGHYECRWVNLKASQDSAFFKKGDIIPVPVAHGEGHLFGGDHAEIGLQYVDENGELAAGAYPINPNGAEADTAGVIAHDGRVLAMMPHPERGFFNWHRADAMKAAELAKRSGVEFDLDGLTPAAQIFANAYKTLK